MTDLKPCPGCGKLCETDGIELCCSCYSKWKESLPELVPALQQRIAELETALEKAIDALVDEGCIGCPALKVAGYSCNNGHGCDRLDNLDIIECWEKYLFMKPNPPQEVEDETNN
jgi:hypothetical protein